MRGGRGSARGGPKTKGSKTQTTDTSNSIPYSTAEVMAIWNSYVGGTDQILDIESLVRYHASIGKEIEEEEAEDMIDLFLNGIGQESKESGGGAGEARVSRLGSIDEAQEPTINFDQFLQYYSTRAGSVAKEAMQAAIETITEQEQNQGINCFSKHISHLDLNQQRQQMDTLQHMMANIQTDEQALDEYTEELTSLLANRVPVERKTRINGGGSMKLQMNLNTTTSAPPPKAAPPPALTEKKRRSNRGSTPNIRANPGAKQIRTKSASGRSFKRQDTPNFRSAVPPPPPQSSDRLGAPQSSDRLSALGESVMEF